MTARKVLVIDDDVIARKIVCRNLEACGYTVIQSSNGKHGWETLWENRDIQLVVTDMMMPDMDGAELLRTLRGNMEFEELPVVLVSGVASAADVTPLLEMGPTVFCSKPLNPTELRNKVEHLLDESVHAH